MTRVALRTNEMPRVNLMSNDEMSRIDPMVFDVAVITRTRDRAIFLRRAISNVLSQTYQNWQHIIVNDGGQQRLIENLTSDFSEGYRGRLCLIHNDGSMGMEAASNKGIHHSLSRYIVIHDDDDSWSPFFLERMIDALKAAQHSNPAVKGIVCHSMMIEEIVNGMEIREVSRYPFNLWLEHISLWRMFESNTFPPISFLFERSSLNELGHFNERLPVLGDWDFNIRFLLKYDIHLLPEILAFYHHRQKSNANYANSHSGDRHKQARLSLTNALLRHDVAAGRIGPGVHIALISGAAGVSRTDWHGREAMNAQFRRMKRRSLRYERFSYILFGVIVLLLCFMLYRVR